MASPVSAQPQLTAVNPTAEVRHVRPVGVPVELERRHVRVRRRVTVPTGCPGREQQGCHQYFETSQLGVVDLRLLEGSFGRLAVVSVRVKHHPADARSVVVAGCLPQQLGRCLELVQAVLGVAVGGLDEAPELVEGTVQTGLPTHGREGDGQQQYLSLCAGCELRNRTNIRHREPPSLLLVELNDSLELTLGRDVPGRNAGNDHRCGRLLEELAFDDPLQCLAYLVEVTDSVDRLVAQGEKLVIEDALLLVIELGSHGRLLLAGVHPDSAMCRCGLTIVRTAYYPQAILVCKTPSSREC